MVFAVTGAFKAIEHKADIFGIVVLATMTGVAGGTIRDVIFSPSLPSSLSDPLYVVITIVTAIAIFFLYKRMILHLNIFLKFDALGLGVFTVIGATFAYTLFGLDFLVMSLAGVLTAVGGGILRDVSVNQVPMVFVKEMYASASFAGVVAFYLILLSGLDLYVATAVAVALTTGLRLIAMKYNWNLPRVKGI